ncbi:MAG: flagellar hook-basal body complex protein FliE [Clostridiaceae bacterium]|nr:flagellar hook-basal body complex protein FliE [Clostridiaceae bacterium]
MAVYGIDTVKNIINTSKIENIVNTKDSVSFKDIIVDALKNVNTLEQESIKMTEDFIAGKTDNIHSVMIASEKAAISLQFVMEVRNKVLEAYQEIMRMQV